jgi:hypothetical protein
LGWATTKTAAVSNPHLALIFPLLCFFFHLPTYLAHIPVSYLLPAMS